MRTAEKLASSIGKGLVAGFAGTAAMTVSSTLEARLRGREPSTAPARATAKALGIASFQDAIAEARFNDLSHWGYGTSWGIVRGLLDAAGLSPRAATAAHGAAVWGGAQMTLPLLDIAPPAVFWPKPEVMIDAFHHAVYAVATGIAYRRLNGRAYGDGGLQWAGDARGRSRTRRRSARGSAIVRGRENLHVASLPAGEIRYLWVGQGRPIVLLHTLRTQLEYFGSLGRGPRHNPV
jgi:hypothetical protein